MELEHEGELSYIQTCIRDSPQAVELRWSLFVAALHSYRFDSVLRPFPPLFVKDNGEKDFKSLVNTYNNLKIIKINYLSDIIEGRE